VLRNIKLNIQDVYYFRAQFSSSASNDCRSCLSEWM